MANPTNQESAGGKKAGGAKRASAKPRRPAHSTIEEKFARLGEITALIEGDAPLEEAIALYKEGLGLIDETAGQLKRHEQEVLVLKKGAEGLFELPPFRGGES